MEPTAGQAPEEVPVAEVAALLRRLLPPGVDTAADTPLTAAGLESMAAARLVLQLHTELGAEIPLEWLGEPGGAAGLAERIASLLSADGPRRGAASAAPPRPDPAQRYAPFDLTPMQQAYLVGRNPDFTPDPAGCSLYRDFEVDNLDQQRLRAAWSRVVRRHDMLRAVVDEDGQRVRPEAPNREIPVHDVSAEDYPVRVAETRERLTRQRYEPGAWPLWEIEATRAPSGSATVHLAIDALITDGIGLDVILADWWHYYSRPEEPLPRTELTVRDCLTALAAERDGAAHRTDTEYWRRRLADLPPGPQLTTSTAQADAAGYRRRPLSAQLSAQEWQALRQRAAEWEASPTALVLTLFADALAHGGARGPFSLVLTVSDRSRLPSSTDRLVGPFTSNLVFPVPATSGLAQGEAVARTHQHLWADLDHAAVSGVEALRSLRRTPALPVVFTSMIGVPDLAREGFAALPGHAVTRTSGVALDHQMWERDGALYLRWDVVDELLPPDLTEPLFSWFVNSLRVMAVEDERRERPLNPLQQAYFVARTGDGGDGTAPAEGCQTHHSFDVADLDLKRLEHAWLRLVDGYEALRSTVTADGRVRVRTAAPARWRIPVLERQTDPEHLGARMVEQPFPLERGLPAELRVSTRDGEKTATVHLAVDLMAADARSAHLLARELWRLYDDPAAAPRPVADPEPLRPPASAEQARYWRERLADLPSGTALTRGGRQGGADRRRVRLETEAPEWGAVKAALREQDVTADAMLLALFTDALAPSAAEPFGLTVVRWPAWAEPCRPGEHTALSWVTHENRGLAPLRRARDYQALLAADAAADGVSGLTELRRSAARRGGASHPVVYTSIFQLSDRPLPQGVTEGPWRTCTPGVALDCVAVDNGETLRVGWDAVPEEFPRGHLEAAFDRFCRLLKQAAADLVAKTPDARGDADAAQRRAAMLAWNDTRREFPVEGPVQSLFERQARERPDEVALRWRDGTMTYAELDRWANQIAWRLRDLGVGPEVAVAIAVRRGPAMVAAVFGVLKAGGYYVPVEPYLPRERAETILATTGATTLLTTSDTECWDIPPQVEAVLVDQGAVAGAAHGDRAPRPLATPDNTAYVIFTSGSTGEPKGVAVQHRPVLNLLDWCRRDFDFGPDDVGLCVTSLGFDLSVFDILGLLGYGASLYVADAEQQRDPGLLLEILLQEPITFWNSAPAALNQLAPLLADQDGQPGTDDLRLVFLSGDYTPLPLPDTLRAVFRGAEIVSLGGATEAVVWSNYFRVGEVDPQWRSIPYGRPAANARYYILDERMEPCPPGVEGDLYIGGECLAAGYFGRPDLTEERFVADPFASGPGARMYRTGDRAAYAPDGLVWFLGRSDDQVKIRGFRVEPGEIEHRLRQHGGVRDAVVLARDDASGDRRLVAYVQPEGPPPSAAELRGFAAQTLPDYMVPNLVAWVDAFPATPNGKLDRAALPWPLPAAAERSVEGTAEDDTPAAPDAAELREEIAALFADRLDTASVDPDADLWDQGATSFTIAQVSTELQKRHRQRVPVAALLNDPTVSAIAEYVAARIGESGERPETAPADTGAARATTTPAQADGARTDRPGDTPETEESPQRGAADSTPPTAHPLEVDFFSPEERAAFKAADLGVRPPEPGARVVALRPAEFAPELYDWRGSHRDFTGAAVSRADFDRLLSLLRPVRMDGRQRRLYPSAGDTYAVQVYVHVRPGGVEGLAEGLYYYRPAEHGLQLIESEQRPDRSLHFYYNRPIFDRAGFELYLVGQTRGIEPLYGADSARYLALEAGYLSQLLMMGQAACGIGLCPVGAVAEDRLRPLLRLDQGHRFLHQLLGGAPTQPLGGAPTGPRPFFAAEPPSPPPSATVSTARTGNTAQRAPDTPAAPAADTAVIGAAGRYPGATDLGAYWRNLSSGVRALGEMPAQRPGAGTGTVGGFLTDPAAFDTELFRVSPAEARLWDPQLKLLLRVVWECLENAGYTAAALRRTAPRIGVFTAVMWHDHRQAGADDRGPGEPAAVTALGSDIPNRISHFFDFQGPSVAVDTSCSSSLTALHMAVQSLSAGECDAAVVTGVNLIGHPYHLEVLSDLGVIASRGDGAAFDTDSTGWLPGEGAGAVLLRPAAAAARERDNLLGIVEATWVGHAGRTSRYGAPNPAAMAESVRQVLRRAERSPGEIGYVECAAAGASVADTAEVAALAEVFADGPPLPIGTVKPSVGHLESAAGMSQVAKVLLQFAHGQLAPTLTDRGDGLVDWDALPLRLVERLEPWTPSTPGAPLRALVNAVGATGTYAHAVLRSV